MQLPIVYDIISTKAIEMELYRNDPEEADFT